MKSLVVLLFASMFWWIGCSMKPDVVVVSKSMRQEANVSSGVQDEFAQSVPSPGQLYWVEGTVKNTGSAEVRNVEITFVATDGNNRSLMIAKVEKIAPGATVPFSTGRTLSNIRLLVAEGEPDITVGK